jgi:excisionase family DNA binding protein
MKEDMLPDRTKFFSTADIARMLSVDASTVKRWADSGRLPCYKTVGGHRRFSLPQVREFVASYHLEGIASSLFSQEPGVWNR